MLLVSLVSNNLSNNGRRHFKLFINCYVLWEYEFINMKIGFPVVIMLRVITRNTFFHLRRSITQNYVLVMHTKKSSFAKGVIT